MKIITIMRYHIILYTVRMAIIKKTQIIDVGKFVDKREASYTVGGGVNWCSHFGKQYGDFLKN